MKTNINNIMDTMDEIKDVLLDMNEAIVNIEKRLNNLEIPQPCDCIVDIDMNKINSFVWEVQELLRRTK